ncbi:MAG: hypothetical protein SWH61_15205 [Thermodesulfobacteriota bacterium]|nr:hypothetical protein [Thermodesulfobacteriota bacterium]
MPPLVAKQFHPLSGVSLKPGPLGQDALHYSGWGNSEPTFDEKYAAVRTAVQLADIATIPLPFYQIPVETGALISSIVDIREADVSTPRKVAAGFFSVLGLVGSAQMAPGWGTLIGTSADVGVFSINSVLLGSNPKETVSDMGNTFADWMR